MRLLLPTLLLLCAGGAAAAPGTPLLWQVHGEAGDLYLLGSVHLLTEQDYPLAPVVDAAYADAEELVFELSPADMQSGEAASRMMKLGALPAGETLQQHVSDETWSAVEHYVAQGGYLPLSAMQRMRPWFLALTLSVMEMQRAGLKPQFGIEQHFIQRLNRDGKHGAGLESIDEQLALFAAGSDEEQDQQLRQSLEQLPDMDEQLERMLALWRAGDGEGLHAMMVEEMADYPAIYQRLITQRNANWIPDLEAQLADPGDELVVVGAAHLVGEDGVVALLRQRGHRVERIAALPRTAID